MDECAPVVAAGALVWRKQADQFQVLVVHRVKHVDWSLPKGKVERGERLPVTAAREVLEETSVPVRLVTPLARISYGLMKPPGATKHVSFWVARPLGDGDLRHEVDDEIDDVRWEPLALVRDLLSYARDRELVDTFEQLREAGAHKSRPLVVLRHAQARSRTHWRGDDSRRTLTHQGLREAHRLVPLLAAYGIARVVSSDSARCVQTIEPYADHLGSDIALTRGLTEEHATKETVADCLRTLARGKTPTVLCTHRRVLPLVLHALGAPEVELEPGQMLVLHRRHGRIVAHELHRP
ncbi:MAG: NUDIX domain-containing protein [Actinomycetota bacterium]|nr:NUDIX domain-containing protein [Actinomycetota bacterium]